MSCAQSLPAISQPIWTEYPQGLPYYSALPPLSKKTVPRMKLTHPTDAVKPFISVKVHFYWGSGTFQQPMQRAIMIPLEDMCQSGFIQEQI